MDNSNFGIYQLEINISKTCSILVGKLGTFTFLAGRYIYTGRAKKNLSQRIDRHNRKNKQCFWHIDYLMANNNVQLISSIIISEKYNDECAENKKLLKEDAFILVKGFGSSDCKNKCGAHLVYLGI